MKLPAAMTSGKEGAVALTMTERRSITREMARRYAKASKKERGLMLDEFCALSGFNRSYGARLLRERVRGPAPPRAPRRRGRTYTSELLPALRKVWAVLDRPCGKRLAAVMAATLAALERHGELALTEEERTLLCRASPATLDRLLSTDRGKLRLKGRALTRPGTLLRNQIPVRTFEEWDHTRAGFLEIDLVSHEGGDPRGEFAYSLCCVDVASGWTEVRVVRNRASRWTYEALLEVRESLPFPLLGLDSDNGGEFINNNLARWCEAEAISFTRSRPYRRNDSCHVEQKNWSVVRRETGYGRYDTDRERALLAEIYADLRLYVNFFSPSVKLIERERVGARVTKRYDSPATPYERLLTLGALDAAAAARMEALYLALNPAELRRRLTDRERRLTRLCALKEGLRRREVTATAS